MSEAVNPKPKHQILPTQKHLQNATPKPYSSETRGPKLETLSL